MSIETEEQWRARLARIHEGRPEVKDRRIAELEAENARLRAQMERAAQHFEARSELYTSPEDVAAGMYACLSAPLPEHWQPPAVPTHDCR